MTHHTPTLARTTRAAAPRRPALHPVALATLLMLSGTGLAHAQNAANAAPAGEQSPTAGSLPPVTVSASGLQLGASDMTTPVTVLEGDELVRRREATLGETLNGEPGITSSHFGAGASRPIIRGMDGPRVKVLSDGAELHDASTIAAVIVEPMAGSTGVLPPPKGYLKRLREICTKHGILLIFDEVITGFGRLGHAFAAERFGVTPDILTFAKGVTSGTVPMGGCMVRQGIYDKFMNGADHVIELFHGYTYTGHPMAAAAGVATMDLYRDEKLFENAKKLENAWADAAFTLKGHPLVEDIRTIGLVAAIDLKPVEGSPGLRAYKAMENGFHDVGMLVRITADTIALSPPLIINENQIDEIFSDKMPKILASVA